MLQQGARTMNKPRLNTPQPLCSGCLNGGPTVAPRKTYTESLCVLLCSACYKQHVREGLLPPDMSKWPRSRDERVCPHGIGHPEPGKPHHGGGIHGCCGCCTVSTSAVDSTHEQTPRTPKKGRNSVRQKDKQ